MEEINLRVYCLLNMQYLMNIQTEMLKRVLEIWVWKNSEPKAR